uniref:NYN domain-containing protein n=1 Tax=Physcomitrium patens TaxID=3218 RepID=A0A2K1JBV5_PHYPA|nr:hypothetical protein PHYPA_019293 [Physcomitrium patens]
MFAPRDACRLFQLNMAPTPSSCLRSRSPLLVYAAGKNQESPQPPRITSNVKRNLHLLKIFKFIASVSLDFKLLGMIMCGSTNDGFELATPVLLVDGYNMCGAWPKLKKHFSRGQLETARDKLIHELITFTHVKGVKVVCVFDAVMSGLPTHKESVNSVDIVYSADTDADSWIEREITLLRADGCPKVWVATSDSFHQQAAHGAGAYVWTCKNLISEYVFNKREASGAQPRS